VHLRDRVALVTGASRGIGRAISLALAHHGAPLLLCGRSRDLLAIVRDQIIREGGSAKVIVCDVTSPDSVAQSVSQGVDEFGTIDILVNNVGGTQPAPYRSLEEYDYESWWKIIDLNLTSQLLLLQAVIPHMVVQRYGRIICISARGAITGIPEIWSPPYVAAKAGVIGLVKQVALEFGNLGIIANALIPSQVETERAQELREASGETRDEWLERFKEQPVARPARPDEIASVVQFLASEECSYITGETVNVVGGSYIAP
jgi:3-oxoacyl-[acyl-carrier protein] reductase